MPKTTEQKFQLHANFFFEINELYNEQQKPYYHIAKVFDDDPYYEIWGEDYQTIDDAKKAIDNGELP